MSTFSSSAHHSAVVRWACFLLAITSVAYAVPGHVSVDSSIQLYEAGIGRAVSWAPPFMSALLRWLGGGTTGSSLFVALVAVMTYSGLYASFRSGSMEPSPGERARVRVIRSVAAVLLVANPVIWLYSGIVWKDVLLAAFVAASVGCFFVGSAGRGTGAKVALVASLFLLLPLPMVRQQGIFLLPLLAIPPIFLLAWRGRRWSSLVRALFLTVVLVASYQVLKLSVHSTIAASQGQDISVGLRSVMIYDLAGIEHYAARGPLASSGADSAITDEVKKIYDGDRIDSLSANPVIAGYFNSLDSEKIEKMWQLAVREHPGAYLRHRANVSAWTFTLNGVRKCLPIHVGVAGIPEYLAAVRITAEQDSRDDWLYRHALEIFGTPWFRHWVYASALVALGIGVGFRAKSWSGKERALILVYVGAGLAFYASFFPTSIACDFRYLYTGVVLVTSLLLALVSGWRLRDPVTDTA